MIDLHTHTIFSDGQLIPSELVRYAAVNDYRAIAITDHGDHSNLDFIIPRIVDVCRVLADSHRIAVIPGIELTFVPPEHIEGMARKARELGARIVVVHGETIVEPVPPGTNLAALHAPIDILAHPGLIDRDYPGRFPDVLQHLLPLGLDGIEAHYSRHSPGETSLYLAVAQHHGLLVTGGSDFHQQEDTGPDLGVGFGSLRVPYRCFLDLRERLSAAG